MTKKNRPVIHLETNQSLVPLIYRLIFFEIMIMILDFVTRIFFLNFIYRSYLDLLIVLLEIIIIQTFNIYVIFRIFYHWFKVKYVISSEEIKIREGIFNIKETTYEIKNLQSMKVIQSLFGRIFNYGSIQLYNPVLKEDVVIKDIPQPHYYGQIIQSGEAESPLLIKRPKVK